MVSTQFDQNEDYSNNMLDAPSTSCNAVGTFGEPEILPRVGDEYQVELPQLLGESYSLSCAQYRVYYSTQDEIRADPQQNFHVGSPIKLAWISSEVELSRDLRKSLEESDNVIGDCSGSNSRLVPGTCDEQWTAAEKDCFLMGLYIFAKNFVEVRKFVGTKEMGALQSYYYGTFYSSPEHRRWSNIRRVKNKKGMFGRGIFSGLRLQELLSRVLPRVADCQNALLEVSKSFENAKISMADYVFTLKAMVGVDILVEAIGIGRAHQDLTVMATKTRHEMPLGKACSSLTTTEIINLLSGDHRLSKARSNDLFWEAVWPRLLANGWHSEQPTSYRHIAGSSSTSLVFLKPGIKKFSRRELVRGDQYFAAVSDVLSKVAREPGLLELNHEEVGCSNGAEQREWTSTDEGRSKETDENHSASLMRFTTVDTCLSYGKVVEFRALPSEASTALDHAHETKTDESEADYASPTTKRARISITCSEGQTRSQAQETNNQPSQVSLSLDMLPSSSSICGSIEQPRTQLLIDLNLPHAPPDSEDGSFAADSSNEQDITSNKLEESDIKAGTEEQSSSNPTRYSTRHRPPTTRVLEAFARGYLTVNRRQRRKEASSHDDHA